MVGGTGVGVIVGDGVGINDVDTGTGGVEEGKGTDEEGDIDVKSDDVGKGDEGTGVLVGSALLKGTVDVGDGVGD